MPAARQSTRGRETLQSTRKIQPRRSVVCVAFGCALLSFATDEPQFYANSERIYISGIAYESSVRARSEGTDHREGGNQRFISANIFYAASASEPAVNCFASPMATSSASVASTRIVSAMNVSSDMGLARLGYVGRRLQSFFRRKHTKSHIGAIPRRALRDWLKKPLTVVRRTLKMFLPQDVQPESKGGKWQNAPGDFCSDSAPQRVLASRRRLQRVLRFT